MSTVDPPHKQIDCFNINIKFCRILGVWPTDSGKYYPYYAIIFLIIFVIIYDFSFTFNFLFLPRVLEIFIEDIIMYCTIVSTVSKTMTFYFLHDGVCEILSILESDVFQPKTTDGRKIIADAKRFNVKFWRIVMVVSVLAHGFHVTPPLIAHLITGIDLHLPVFSCDLLPENVKKMFIYPLYFYEVMGIHIHMWYNVNIDGLFMGVMIFIIAQLDILSLKLKNVTSDLGDEEIDKEAIKKLNDCIIHYDKLAHFCSLVQDTFSATLFVQIGTASMVICVCLFRFTMPAPTAYYVYLVSYIIVMMVQRAVPCWFGTQIIDKSTYLAHSIYDCDWTPRSKYFKSSLRLFVERVNRPLNITCGKMVVLSLDTFTSIINSAYSFYTLLRHMQSREN